MDIIYIDGLSQVQEGQLSKYTNVVKGWQYRWFILDPKTGKLSYFLSENDTKLQPRGQISLKSAIISPSDEDNHTFSVNSSKGECYKLRAANSRARQDWINRLRAAGEYHSQKNLQIYQPTSDVSIFSPSTIKKSLATARKYLYQAEHNFIDITRVIEQLPTKGSGLRSTDPDLLIIKATTQSMICALENCYKILQKSNLDQQFLKTHSLLKSKSFFSSKRKLNLSS